MKRKDKIIEQARILFNAQGIDAISLKTIAKEMGISYGNVTYHFANKELLVQQLYKNMMEAHYAISQQFQKSTNLLEAITLAPLKTFDISFHYRFIFTDIAIISRKYPSISNHQKELTTSRMQAFLPLFGQLKTQGLFRKDIDTSQIQFLMQASGELRTFFFMRYTTSDDSAIFESAKQAYFRHINQLLYPYLTPAGINIYQTLLKL